MTEMIISKLQFVKTKQMTNKVLYVSVYMCVNWEQKVYFLLFFCVLGLECAHVYLIF